MPNTAPTLTRTWQFDVNQVVIGSTTQPGGATDGPGFRRQLLMDIKESLTGFATNPWTVTRSAGFSSGYNASGDAWGTDIDEIRWANSTSATRSWIVLRNSTLGLEFCFDCYNSSFVDGSLADVFIARTGDPFTGGSTTARATSPTEIQILSGTDFASFGSWGAGAGDATARAYTLHVMHSTDGLATRVFICLNTNVIGFWQFEAIANAVGSPTNGYVARVRASTSSDTATSANLDHVYTNARTKGIDNSNAGVDYYLATLGNNFASTTFTTRMNPGTNPYDGRLPLAPVGVASTTAGWVGFFGEIADMWFGVSQDGAGYTGRGYPTSTRALMQFGDVVVPWDGSVPITT
jgi:hypothetical protein